MMTIPGVKLDSLRSIFSGDSKDLTVEYDEEKDSLCVFMVKPQEQPVVHYALNDKLALLVDTHNHAVGFQLAHFQTEYLQTPELAELKTIWEKKDLAHEYVNCKFFFDPQQQPDGSLLAASWRRRCSGNPWLGW